MQKNIIKTALFAAQEKLLQSQIRICKEIEIARFEKNHSPEDERISNEMLGIIGIVLANLTFYILLDDNAIIKKRSEIMKTVGIANNIIRILFDAVEEIE